MKTLMKSFFFAAAIAFLAAGCSGGGSENKDAKSSEATTQQKADVYECPMKCEGSKSDKPGKCKMCGMELQKVS